MSPHPAHHPHPFPDLAEITEARFTDWCLRHDDFRAAFVVGSRARIDHPADEWSDLDIVLFCRQPEHYFQHPEWIREFASLWLCSASRTAGGEPERLNLLKGGLQMDIVFHSEEDLRGMKDFVAAGSLPDTLYRGTKILFDKDQLLPPMPAPASAPPAPAPTQEEFGRFFQEFWFSAVYTAKQLCRKDLFFFKTCDARLKGQLLPLLEWHARSRHDADYEPWHGGRFVGEWADPDVQTALKQTFTGMDVGACWQAFFELVQLFRRLLRETAETYRLSCPLADDEAMFQYLLKLRSEAE